MASKSAKKDKKAEDVAILLASISDGAKGSKSLKETKLSAEEDETFKEWYVNQLTRCFGEELDALRKTSENFGTSSDDITNLVAALQTGQSDAVFEPAAKRVVLNSLQSAKKKTKRST